MIHRPVSYTHLDVYKRQGQIKLLGKLNGPLHMVSVPHISSVDLQQPVLIVWLSHFHPFCSVKKAYKNSRTSIYTLKSGYIQNQSVVVFLPCYSVKRSPSSSNALLYMSTESVDVYKRQPLYHPDNSISFTILPVAETSDRAFRNLLLTIIPFLEDK